MSNNRRPRRFGGRNFAFVARGYSSEINRKAKQHRNKGYLCRVIRDGRQRLLYVGPMRSRSKRVPIRKKLPRRKIKR